MDEQVLLRKLIQTFPKTKIVPKFDYNPAGLAPCVGVGCGQSTSLLSGGRPWHKPCRLQSLGIPSE